MSVTFIPTDLERRPLGPQERTETACLCAQGCPGWDMYAPPDLRPALREHADPSCHFCGGTGVEVETVRTLFLNLCCGNARALLALLGLAPAPSTEPFDLSSPVVLDAPTGPDYLYGSIALPEARRAVMLARATFDRRAPVLVRAPVEVSTPARVEHEGNLARLVPGISASLGGLDLDGLRDRLDAFAELVEDASRLGAPAISWA